MGIKVHAVPKECRGAKEEFVRRTFTTEDAEDLRHQMYMYCITNGFTENKEEAKKLLKKFGFLKSK